MVGLQASSKDLKAASNDAQEAADLARGRGSSGALASVGAALPGATSRNHLAELGRSWDDEVARWATSVRDFGDDLAATGEDYRASDLSAEGGFGILRGLLGGGS